MLISFSVSNFRSIYNTVKLDMLPAKIKGNFATKENVFKPKGSKNLEILKSAVIYGANASGKSNILKALEFFKDFLLGSSDYKFNQKLPFEPFKLFRIALNEPSVFNIEFLLNGVNYEYGFIIDSEKVLEEHLISYSSRKPSEIFKRIYGEAIKFGSSFKGEKKSLEAQLLPNNLLLTKAVNSNFEQFQDIYIYFQEKFNVFTDEFSENNYSLSKAFSEEYFKSKIVDFLKKADTGIESINVQQMDIDHARFNFHPNTSEEIKRKVLEDLSYKATVSHISCEKEGDIEMQQVKWDMEEESAGTQKLFALAGPIIDILEKGSILIFDEINNSLHPIISKFIIELFNNPDKNPNGAQLIFTTHDTTLLDSYLFRRDQIWLTEKNNCGFTELTSLCSFDVRDGSPIDKWYLTGRFGALPFVESFNVNSN